MHIKEKFYAKLEQLREERNDTKDVLRGGLKRTDLGLSDKLNKKGKLSKHTQTWMKRLANSSGSLYSRPLGKPKGYLPEEQFREDYDQNARKEKENVDATIKDRMKKGLRRRTWIKHSKELNKKAVTGLEEAEQLDEISKEKIKRKKNPGPKDKHGGLYKITKGTYRTGSSRENETEISHGKGRKITKALRSEKDPEKKSEKWKKFWNTGSLEEAEQLDELRGKNSLSDDERKKLKRRIYKKHGKAWNDTIYIRKKKKSAGPADTKDMDKYRNRLAKMHNKLDK